MFCAAIPATLAVGAHAKARQRQRFQQAEAPGEERRRPAVPAGPVTAAAVAGLVLASVIYHTQVRQ
jgi:hypothetical protein